jgi:hypothetical protein
MSALDQKPYITVTRGMAGYFAVMITYEDGFPEPWETGAGRYATEEEAVQEAVGWARDEDMPFSLVGYDPNGTKIT